MDPIEAPAWRLVDQFTGEVVEPPVEDEAVEEEQLRWTGAWW